MTINYGILFALLSLDFAGINDVVFKVYSAKDSSKGLYVFGIGLTWGLLQLIMLFYQKRIFYINHATIGFGIAAGLVVTIANILLIESLTHIDVSLGSTIYRLNTIGVVLLSFLLLRESMDVLKIIGILVGLLSILMLYQKQGWLINE